MRRFMGAVDVFTGGGWKINVFCQRADEQAAEAVTVTYISSAKSRIIEELGWFTVIATIKMVFVRRNPECTIIHSAYTRSLIADVVSFNFSSYSWLPRLLRLRFKSSSDWLSIPKHVMDLLWETILLKVSRPKVLLANSMGLAIELKSRCSQQTRVFFHENYLIDDRFCVESRKAMRVEMRRELGYAEEDVVLVFSSHGHYARKGFYELVVALDRIASKLNGRSFRLLVIGGKRKTLEKLGKKVLKLAPSSKNWISFAGQQQDSFRWMAAGDAFVYPSNFDSSANVVIEASALGLDLLLSRHYGAEKYLKEGKNGFWLPRRGEEMASVIRKYLDCVEPNNINDMYQNLITQKNWGQALVSLYEAIHSGTLSEAFEVDGLIEIK